MFLEYVLITCKRLSPPFSTSASKLYAEESASDFISGFEFLPFQTKIMCSKLRETRSRFLWLGNKKLSKISKFNSLVDKGFSRPLGVKLLYDSTIPHMECGKLTKALVLPFVGLLLLFFDYGSIEGYMKR